MTRPAKGLPANGAAFAAFLDREFASHSWGWSRWEVWRSFVFWSLADLQENAEGKAEQEKRFRDLAGTWAEWLEALKACVTSAPLEDALGMAYMRVGLNNKQFAQFFTPGSVAQFMAAMTMGNGPLPEDDRLQRGIEPSAGSGVMILAAEAQRRQAGLPYTIWTAIDLDPVCAAMTAIQLYLNDIPAVVLCGDSLRFGTVPGERAHLVMPRLQIQAKNGEIRRVEEVDEPLLWEMLDSLEESVLGVVALRRKAAV